MKLAPLIAASAVFFFLWAVMPVTLASHGSIGSGSVIILLSLVSLAGSVQFLRAMRHESPRWFWGIPFAAVCTALALWTGITRWVVTVPDIGNHVFLFLLPPAAALFFYSFPDDCRSRVMMPIAISALVSVLSLILAANAFCTLVPGTPVPGFMAVAMVLYTLLLMPLVGLLFIVTGAACK
ncbi:hypothetical protein SZ63_03140 [Methanoculleus sediminis]|uniref:Transmembrane protein n=1 Tax=Methanoculleus sediminis TaxID=1550566 RepID=A0A0H1QZ30_9EURY|nr:hypothetical protein [Methanoculleus sediminis]KLK88079.1 hypothetical protein SZ63_03140 [Methanoculleus sediminis]